MMNEDMIKKVFKSLINVADDNDLKEIERPRYIKLMKDPWAPENAGSIMTPTMKIKRNQAQKLYEKDIEYLY